MSEDLRTQGSEKLRKFELKT